MDDLSERIRASLETSKSDPWFPELTPEVTASAWDKLGGEIGLTPDSYGTARVLFGVVAGPRDIVRCLETCRPNCGMAPSISMEALPLEVALRYKKAGITFYSSGDILNTPVLTCVDDALSIINRVPSLMRTVAALVRSFHVIKPKDLNNDVSFSEPEVPFSIFVSVPEERVENDALRVAEAIVHEAMHLQLTMIEELMPLVNRTRAKYFSPWRMTYRPAQGVLHALYVFGVINEFLSQLSSRTTSANHVRQYADVRRADIGSQINAIEGFQYAPDLTSVGLCFVENLLEV